MDKLLHSGITKKVVFSLLLYYYFTSLGIFVKGTAKQRIIEIISISNAKPPQSTPLQGGHKGEVIKSNRIILDLIN